MANKDQKAMSGAVSGAASGATIGGPWGAVIGGALGAVGGLMGGDDGPSQSEILMQEIYSKYAGLQLPDIEKMKLALEEYKVTADPSMETPEQMGLTDNLENVTLDPRLEQARMAQLETMSKLGETSFTPSEQAQLNKMQRSVESDNQSRLKAMLQQQDMRGVGSSDAALASRMLQSQSAANRQAQESDNQASMAFERALAAKSAAANIAQGIQGDDYNRQSALAQALNAREAANVQSRSGVGQRNIDRFNDAQKTNMSTSMANTNMRNSQQQFNKNLQQQDYDNELKRLAGQTGLVGGFAKAEELSNAENSAKNQGLSNTLAGVGNIASSLFGGPAKLTTTDSFDDEFKKAGFSNAKTTPSSMNFDPKKYSGQV